MIKIKTAYNIHDEYVRGLVSMDVEIRQLELKIRMKEYAHIRPQLKNELEAINNRRIEQVIAIEACKQTISDYLREESKN